MPIKHSLWSVGTPPRQLSEGQLPSELMLHQMIKAAPELLSPDWMLIGSEVPSHGGRLDLLAVAPDGSLVLIELKRGRTPREVVAQALDYASWVEELQADEIAAIYHGYAPGRSLAADFEERFRRPLGDEELNANHELVIVASELDAATERIVQYLNRHGIGINVLFFRVFEHPGGQLLSRAWLVDPVDTPSPKPPGPGDKEPWNGEYYVSFGEDASQSWAEARRYGFISASGGAWYTRTMKQLSPGDRVWVNIPGQGYVGVGVVDGPMQPLSEFTITVDGRGAARGRGADRGVIRPGGDRRRGEVRLLRAHPLAADRAQEQAVKETGFFGNQNTVAAPRAASWRSTVERLKTAFPDYDAGR